MMTTSIEAAVHNTRFRFAFYPSSVRFTFFFFSFKKLYERKKEESLKYSLNQNDFELIITMRNRNAILHVDNGKIRLIKQFIILL